MMVEPDEPYNAMRLLTNAQETAGLVADAELTQSPMQLSEPAFMQAWDNEEDAVYDDL